MSTCALLARFRFRPEMHVSQRRCSERYQILCHKLYSLFLRFRGFEDCWTMWRRLFDVYVKAFIDSKMTIPAMKTVYHCL